MIERAVEPVGRFERYTMPDDDRIYFEPEPHAYYGEIKESAKARGGYSFVRDSRLTGVSTPTKSLDTNIDPLLYWAAKLDQTGIADLVDRQISGGCEVDDLAWLCSQKQIAQALRDHELTWADVRDRAAIRGTNVHERVFLALATGKRPPSLASLSAEERAYGQAAIRWWRDRKPRPLYAEQVTLCRSHNVAGRFDLLCEIERASNPGSGLIPDLEGLVLADAKTRAKGVARRSDHAQLPGYEMCNVACGIGSSDRRLVLLLLPDGSYREVECVGTEADFIAGLEAYRAGGDLEKRMRAAAKAEREAVPA